MLPDRFRPPSRRPRRRAAVRRRRAVTLFAVLVFGVILMGIAGGVMLASTQQTLIRNRYEVAKDEFAAAEEALNKAFSQIQFLINMGTPDFFGEVAAITPPEIENFTFPQFEITKVADGNEAITEGQWAGLTLYRLRYRIDVTAKKQGGSADRFEHHGAALSQNLEITYIPLCIFAIFYDPTMEIAPGPYMRINGRVHANGDAFFQSNSGLDFLAGVTVAGNVYHGRHPESGQSVSNGYVSFNNGSDQVSMQRADGDGWLTSTDPDWANAALQTWSGGLKDRALGVSPLSLPIPTSADPHSIIERADPANDSYSLTQEKFEYKAGLTIEVAPNGTVSATDADGQAVALTYPDPANPSKTKSVVA
ncbi:MAG: hypothetical protein M1457_13495, partial [bacterium]|nr:hypothetical protein [bacterium]